jgi:hypothetical protein
MDIDKMLTDGSLYGLDVLHAAIDLAAYSRHGCGGEVRGCGKRVVVQWRVSN